VPWPSAAGGAASAVRSREGGGGRGAQPPTDACGGPGESEGGGAARMHAETEPCRGPRPLSAGRGRAVADEGLHQTATLRGPAGRSRSPPAIPDLQDWNSPMLLCDVLPPRPRTALASGCAELHNHRPLALLNQAANRP
jgi:hypothetical protein